MVETRYAVVGGGIVGASVAFHLRERTDAPITVYERGELASATTAKATAMIGVAGPDPFAEMKAYGFRQYNEFFADPAAEPEYRQSGRVRVATTDDGARTLEAAVEDSRGDRAGEDRTDAEKYANSLVDYVPGDRLSDRFLLPPVATERLEGALYRPEYGYVQSDSRMLGAEQLALEFVERARERGVDFETGTAVTDVRVADGGVTGIELDGSESVAADAVVCAAGPWNRDLAATAGVDLPIGHRLSTVFSLELDEALPYDLPMLKVHEAGVGIHPKRRDRVLLTYSQTGDESDGPSQLEPSDVGERAPAEQRELALQTAREVMPLLADAELADEWVGLGTTTPDGNPIVGWSAVEGLSLAATMTGIQYAPAVGDVVARQLVDGDPTEYYDALTISRFEGYEDSRR